MKFICLGYYDPRKWEQLTEEERNDFMDECIAYDDELRRKGHFAGGEALDEPSTAKTLRYSNKRLSVTDGPYAETKEQIGGILILEADNLEHAVELMSNLMPPGPARAALLAGVDFVKLIFLALLAYFAITIVDRMGLQRMTVFDLPMSYVYYGVAVGCIGMFLRQAQNLGPFVFKEFRNTHPHSLKNLPRFRIPTCSRSDKLDLQVSGPVMSVE